MPCIWGQHSGSQLLCAVTILPHTIGSSAQPGAAYSGAMVAAVRALIDTGATTTCISANVVQQVGLQPIGKIQVQGVSGIVHHNGYLFCVGFPFALLPSSPLPALAAPPPAGAALAQLHILQKVIQGCDFPGAANFDVLLGMDVISTGSLVVQGGTNSFSFSF
jgi:Aspartyl protease